MDFGLDRETEALRERVRAFLEEAVIPREAEAARNLDRLCNLYPLKTMLPNQQHFQTRSQLKIVDLY